MKDDVLETQYFGTYVERMETDTPAEEFVGNVSVRELNGNQSAFFYIPRAYAPPLRYDLPQFMRKFDKCCVALLARKYQKQVGDRTYHKLCVISVRLLYSQARGNQSAD